MSDPALIGDRFWSKVDKTETCWLWTAYTNDHGYGQFRVKGKRVRAHRFSYELFIGPIPKDKVLDHICHTRHCVNPEHLRLTTHKENCENLAGARSNSTSGMRGVSWYKRYQKWRAQVQHNSQIIHVGYFNTITEAQAAVIAKRLELFTHNDLDRMAS